MLQSAQQTDYIQALALKESGNTAYQSAEYQLALKHYSQIFVFLGMNPPMNMNMMMGSGASTKHVAPRPPPRDPMQRQIDDLRLSAFNNMAAVYCKMGKWKDCKEKCSRVLQHDDQNIKALFRRGMAHRKLNALKMAKCDML